MASERIVNVAALVTERYKLSHPIDIRAFAESVATVKVDDLPEGLDGFIYYYPERRPPYICVKDQYVPRLNFTLAHELGHYFLPWHPRVSRKCSPEDKADLHLHMAQETEANVFAGELLAPKSWINGLFSSHNAKDVFEILVADGYLSYEAACINISKWDGILAIRRTNTDGSIDTTYNTLEYSRSYPFAKEPPKEAHYTAVLSVGKNIFHFYQYNTPAKELLPHSGRTGKHILAEILNCLDESEGKRLARSIQGSIAAANSNMRSATIQEFHSRCIERLRRDEFKVLHTHKLFEMFVSERCRELRPGLKVKG